MPTNASDGRDDRDDKDGANGTDDFDEIEQSIEGMRSGELDAEDEQTLDEMKASSWVSDDCPPELAAQFWRGVVAYEQAPWTTNLQLLEEAGIHLPDPVSMDDRQLTVRLWEMIDALAQMRVFISQTDHLSDRELYMLLWSELLREPTKDMPRVEGSAWHLDLLGSGGEEDNHLYLKYYADEEWRRRWLADFPDDTLPDHEEPPFDRDRHLPQTTGGSLTDLVDGEPM